MSEPSTASITTDSGHPSAVRAPWWKRAGVEALAVLIVLASGLIILGQWINTAWEINLLYSGDSLVLPLLRESILAGQPFEWVFSSQLFLFPETPTYWVVSAFTSNPRTALAGIAILNLLLLYVLLRWCSRLLFRHSRHRILEISVALGATAMYVVYVLLEPVSDINGTAIASLFLLVSYYPGVIISGLTSIALILWTTRAFTDPPVRRTRTLVFVILFVTLGALTGASNPLFWMQVLAPLAATLLIAFAMKRLSRAWFWTLAGTIAVTVAIGYVLRQFLERYTSLGVGSYVDLSLAGESFLFMRNVAEALVATPQGFLKLVLASIVLLIASLPIIRVLLRRDTIPGRWHVASAEFILAVFSWVSVASLLIGMVVTGTLTTRYLVPVLVFPLLPASYEAVKFFRTALLSIRDARVRHSVRTYGLVFASSVAVLILIGGAIAAPKAATMALSENRGGAACAAELPADAKAGVGTFWLTRNWDLYGTHDYPILQVNPDLTVHPWMINLASYEDQDFNFVIIDPWGFVTEESVEPLGEPAGITECSGYFIYDYEGTEGKQLLNERVESGLEAAERLHGFD
ncbi:hypothetical protein [Agromyces sp. Soil535]|uniref:hypothetical protein n=1 Tax=Agromyces sp. Soil535 TaxID=1736390 RepID=UPI0006F6E7B8|nr:hypothetical protein [Agromyces sp. Soil535]KRE26036.1 hypothetical protein ASG80_04265 [Agromyces sp. Soil535]